MLSRRTPIKRSRIKRTFGSVKAQCVRLFMAIFRGRPCEICTTEGKIVTGGTVGHHIIKRSIAPNLVCEILNILVLCPWHHFCAHENTIAYRAWMAKHKADVMEVLNKKRLENKKPDYRALLERLKGGRNEG